MRKLKLILSLLVLGYLGQSQSIERAVFSNGGQTVSNNSLNVDFTIGETIINGSSINLSQGFQQTDGFVTSVLEFDRLNVEINTFPNPVTEVLNVIQYQPEILALNIDIFNMNGQLMLRTKMSQMQDQIDLKHFMPGLYKIVIRLENRTAKTSLLFIKI